MAPPPKATPAGWEGILAPGERILWQGRPLARPDWPALLRAQVLFGLVFAGFALFWIAQAWRMADGSPAPGALRGLFPLFGLPFLVVGLNLALGPALRPWLAARGTWYTLTDRNAYIATRRPGRRSLTRHPLTARMLPALEDGSPGSVWFASEPGPGGGAWRGAGAAGRYGGAAGRIGFRSIPEARTVYRLLLEAISALAPADDTPAAAVDSAATAGL